MRAGKRRQSRDAAMASSSLPSLASSMMLALTTVLMASGSVGAQVSMTPSATTDGVSGLSKVLNPSFAGMGIEPSNLFAFTGTTSPNQMTMQLLGNLANYTGAPPHIRVGGNTGDTAVFESDYNGYYFIPNPATTGPTDAFVYGPDFFKVINYFPKGTPITYGLPLAYNGTNATASTVQIVQRVINAFTNVRLYSLEVGNEPDLYVQNRFRPSGWGASDFGNEWINVVQAVYQQALLPKKMTNTFFEAACTATTAANRGFRIEDLVQTGVATENGVYLAGWNQHDYYYYVGVSNYQLSLSGLMDLGSTEGQFTEWAKQAAQAAVTGKPYFLREMGSIGPEGIQGISDTFGNALWTLNFFLYAATVGVDSVQLHMLQYSYGSPWQPIADQNGNGPFIRPSYYAWAAMAQINGARCQSQVAQVQLNNVPSQYNNRLGAYAVYNAGKLQSLVLINSKTAYSSQGSGISNQQISISLPSLAGQTFYLSLLTASGADAQSGTQWNGYSYEQGNTGVPRRVDSTPRTVVVGSDGTLTFTVRDSQAIVANLGSLLGTTNNVVDTTACAQFAQVNATSDSGSGFKATSGFAKDTALSLGAIIGIAVGGGVALLAVLALCIWCCVRRSRRRRGMRANDSSKLLPPPYQKSSQTSSQQSKLGSGGRSLAVTTGAGKRQMYNTIPVHDGMVDSSDDISMTPFRNAGKFQGHKHSDSYGSGAPSMTNSPLLPASPNYVRTRVDSYESNTATLPAAASGNGTPTRSGSPKPVSRRGGATAAAAGTGAILGGGAAAAATNGGVMLTHSNLNPLSQNRYSVPQRQQTQEAFDKRRSAPQPQQYVQAPVDPWQQLAQQHQQQQQLYSGADRARFISSPGSAATAAAAAAAAAAQDPNYSPRRNSLPGKRTSSPSRRTAGAAAGTRPSGSASSQGHGNRNSRQDFSPRPPVPQLPESIRNSVQMTAGGGGDAARRDAAAAAAAAGGGSGSTAAAQRAYAAQKRQHQKHQSMQQQQMYQRQHMYEQQQQRQSVPASQSYPAYTSTVGDHALFGYGDPNAADGHPQYGMAVSTPPAYAIDTDPYQRSGGGGPARLDPNAYAMASQPRTSSELAYHARTGSAQQERPPMAQTRSHVSHNSSHESGSGGPPPRPARRSTQQPRQNQGGDGTAYDSYGGEQHQRQR